MAVGMILRCDLCGKSYDEGKTYHPAHCDGGEEVRRQKEALDVFMSLSTNERLEIVYREIRDVKAMLGQIPYNGPIG